MRRLRSKFLETGMRTYATDLTEAQWALVDSIIPEGKPGGRPRSIDVRAAVNAIFYLLRTGCQWRLLPREFPPWPTVYYYFRRWEQESVWLTLLRSLYPLARLQADQGKKTTYPGRYARHSDCQPSRRCLHVRSARSRTFVRRPGSSLSYE